jgi:zinc transporter 2
MLLAYLLGSNTSIDITSFVISLAAIYLSRRSSTATHTFGYHRAEVLGALSSIFLIWGLTFVLVIEAYDRVKHPIDINGKTMAITAGLGVFVNIL